MDCPDKKEDNTEFGLLHKISKLERIKCVVWNWASLGHLGFFIIKKNAYHYHLSI